MQEENIRAAVYDFNSALNRDECCASGPHVRISRNFPNPFSRTTRFIIELGREMMLSVTVYNSVGRAVRLIEPSRLFRPGKHEIVWNGRDNSGGKVGSGVYVCEIRAEHRPYYLKVSYLSL